MTNVSPMRRTITLGDLVAAAFDHAAHVTANQTVATTIATHLVRAALAKSHVTIRPSRARRHLEREMPLAAVG